MTRYILLCEASVSVYSFGVSRWEPRFEVYLTEQDAQAAATHLREKLSAFRNVRVFEGKELAPRP